MPYPITSFGNGVLVGSGGNVVSNVHNQFGARTTGGVIGVNKIEGVEEELVFNFTGADFADLGNGLIPFVIPAGAQLLSAYIDVEKVFVLTGTTPVLNIGTQGSEATNGFTISQAILQATGTANLTSTLKGTWVTTAPLQANTIVGFALGGTTPAMTRAGKARIIVKFDRVNRAPSPALAGGPALP